MVHLSMRRHGSTACVTGYFHQMYIAQLVSSHVMHFAMLS